MRDIAIILLACLSYAVVRAQDTDPFFAGRSPLILDPSRAGFSPGAQVSFIHQDQFLQLPGAWRSDLLTIDVCARNTKKAVRSWLGVGLSIARDLQGLVGTRNTSMGVMPAIHLRSGRRSFLSAGIELRGLHQVMGDANGAWGSQYDGKRHDAGIDSGERWMGTTQAWLGTRAGISWTLKNDLESPRRRERDLLVVGVSADHLGRIQLSDGGMPTTDIPLRSTAYVLGEAPHEIWDNGFFAAEIIGHAQGPFRTARVNVYAGKHLLNRTGTPGQPLIGFKAGIGYRVQDALLVTAAIDVGRGTLGMAYGWAFIHRDGQASGPRTFEVLLQLRAKG